MKTKRRVRKSDHGDGHLFRRKGADGKAYGNYAIRFYKGGKRYDKNLGTTDFAEAKRAWHEWALERKTRHGHPVSDQIGVETWLTAFMEEKHHATFVKGSVKPATFERYKTIVGHFARFLGHSYPGIKMCELDTKVFDEYMAWRLTQTRMNKGNYPITKACVNLELGFLATAFRRAVKEKVLPTNPVTDVVRFGVAEDSTAELSPWSFEQVATIIREVEEDARDAVALVALTGCRRGEMAHLRWGDVDFERGEIRINGDQATEWTPKTRHGYRRVPMCRELGQILTRRKAACKPAEDEAVFDRPGNKPLHSWPDFALRRFQTAIRRLRKRGLDIPMGSLRTLRHWFISYAINREVDPLTPLEVQRIVGHGNLDMIQTVYYHADKAKVKQKLLSIGDGLFENSDQIVTTKKESPR